MTRLLELLVSLLIVAALVILVGVMLPSRGHLERSVEVPNPIRQIYDSLNTMRRFPDWSPERRLDPLVSMKYSGERSGDGAKVEWSGNETVGKGSLTIASSVEDEQVVMDIDNNFAGVNKKYTIDLVPSENGKTTKIVWNYDVDYGWDLFARYAGLYIHGKPDANVQTALANISAMLASFPNVDYKDQDIQVSEVTGVPVLLLPTKSPRTLDEVAEATAQAVTRIQAVMSKAGLTQNGPVRTVTSNWGDDSYAFDVAVPVNATSFTIDGSTQQITEAVQSDTVDDLEPQPTDLTLGQRDEEGQLYIADNVRARISYSGPVLTTEYTGSPAALPLLRLQLKAFAETHGYFYSEMNGGRFWDEVTATSAEGEETFKVYLPVEP